jgi:branched-chain amino acid transport system ATP-binding protein
VTVLKIDDIHTYYGESYILQGISLEVKEGQVIGILGRNGMGKTTLMRSIMGFTPPRRGRITFQEVELTGKRSYEISKMGISLVPQGRQIFPSLSVEENLTVVYRPCPNGWDLERVYEFFAPLRDRSHHPGNHLSGGEQQMLAVGRSLMTNPTLLLMDEPTEGLSPLYVQTVGQIIRRLQESGIAILLVEQNLSFTLKHTDYIHVLNQGLIVHSSTPQELGENKDIRTRFLGV